MKNVLVLCLTVWIAFVGCVKSKTLDATVKEGVQKEIVQKEIVPSVDETRAETLALMSISLPSIPVKGEVLLGGEATVGLKDATGTVRNLGERVPALIPAEGLITYPADYPAFQGAVDTRHTASSFVIDYDGAEFFFHHQEIKKKWGDQVAMEKLIPYVSSSIAPSYEHGMLLASDVAQKREGDCTELAFFLAALARSVGIPAQVVLGLVLVQENKKIVAFGHAWVEYYHEGWHLADAALGELNMDTRYLPATVLQNEGPSYGLMLLSHMQGSWANEILLN